MTDYLVFCSFPAPSADSGYSCSLHTRLVYGYKSGSSGHIVFCFAPCNILYSRNMACGSLCNSLDTAAEATHHDAAELAAPIVVFVPDIGKSRVFVAVSYTHLLFEELYAKYQSLPRYKRKALILKEMRPHFKDEDGARLYVCLLYTSRCV